MVSLPVQVVLSALTRPARHRYGPDPSQVADLHLPSGPGPHPVVVLLHGGSWRTGYGRIVCRPLARSLRRSGRAVWNLEYRRLGEGRGGGGGWPATFQDVAAGIDALAELPTDLLDLARVDVVGHSAGGQLALWAAGRPQLASGALGASPRVGAARVVGLAPVTDLWRAGDSSLALLGGPPDELPDRWQQADPSRRPAPPVPTLLVHPTADETIPVARSREYSARTGVPLVETAGVHRDPIDPTGPAWSIARDWLLADRPAGIGQAPG